MSRHANYSIGEDQHLCKMFLDASQDPIVGTNQSRDQFWKIISEKFHSEKPDPPCKIQDRNERSLQCRMGTILKKTRKFNGCLSQVEYRNPSGASEQDLYTSANDLLMQQKDYENDFKFEHVWYTLKNFVQAETTSELSSQPAENIAESPNPSLSSFALNLDSDEGFTSSGSSSQQRPEGVKKAKLKRKQNEDMFIAAGIFEKENEKFRQTLLASAQMKTEAKMLLRDDNILMIDLDTVRDPSQREYFRQEQQKILQKRGITPQVDSSYFPNIFSDIGGSGNSGLSDY